MSRLLLQSKSVDSLRLDLSNSIDSYSNSSPGLISAAVSMNLLMSSTMSRLNVVAKRAILQVRNTSLVSLCEVRWCYYIKIHKHIPKHSVRDTRPHPTGPSARTICIKSVRMMCSCFFLMLYYCRLVKSLSNLIIALNLAYSPEKGTDGRASREHRTRYEQIMNRWIDNL